jgi:multidrug efflux system membrane fusion protein
MASPDAPGAADQGPSWVLWVLLTAGIAASVGGYYFYTHRESADGKDAAVQTKSGSGGGAKAIPVIVATSKKGDLPIYLTGLGSVLAYNSVTVHTRVDGELINVAFTEGQLVKAGDLLCEIDPRPWLVQLETAQGQLKSDTANNMNAKLNLQRFQEAKDAISQQQIDTQVATVTQTEGALQIDQAAIDNAKLQLTYARITSPITGRIGLRLVDKGNIVHAADLGGVAVITQLQPIAVVFALPQDDVPIVLAKPNQGTDLPVEVYGRDLKKKIATGKLLTLDNQVDPTTGTVKFKAEFSNEDNVLFPNAFVNARLLVDTLHGAIIVPSAAVQRSPTSAFVYVVKSDNKVELRNVETGPSEAEQTVVTKGLNDGEIVVVEGVDKLQTDALVSFMSSSEKKGDHASGDAKPEHKGDHKGGKPHDTTDDAKHP